MADPETVRREHGCGCGVDVFGCLVHKIIIAGQAQPEGASCAPAVTHDPGAPLGHAAEDVRELLQVLCQRRGLPAPVYKVRPIRGDVRVRCAWCVCGGACAQWVELMVVVR